MPARDAHGSTLPDHILGEQHWRRGSTRTVAIWPCRQGQNSNCYRSSQRQSLIVIVIDAQLPVLEFAMRRDREGVCDLAMQSMKPLMMGSMGRILGGNGVSKWVL